MKISKSKRQLAQLLIEVGVTQFPEGANWAAQDKRHNRFSRNCGFYRARPVKPSVGCSNWSTAKDDHKGIVGEWIEANTLIPNWHQTVLSRDEFDQIIAETVVGSEPDSDGWIEWKGGECPVERGTLVDVKYGNGITNKGVSALTNKTQADHVSGSAGSLLAMNWDSGLPMLGIIAYRLHKPEKSLEELCGEVKEENKHEHVEAKQTIEQLAADYRNRKDYADRKQAEADAAKAEADAAKAEAEAKLAELVAAGNAIGLVISVAEKEPELVITDWRDLMIGDVIEYVDGAIKDKIGMTGPVVEFAPDANDGMYVRLECDNGPNKGRLGWPTEWRFIRRPAK